MGSLQNGSPALRRSQSHLRRSALCALVLAVSFLAGFYLKTPFQTTGVKSSDVYPSPPQVFPPRRKLIWVADKFDPLRKLCISTDIHRSIREYIEVRYLTELSMNGTINPKPFMLNCYYADDVNAIHGIRFLIAGSSTTGLVCSSAVESVEIRAHSSWMCSMDMAHMHYFIPSSNKPPQRRRRRRRPDGISWQQQLPE